MLGLMIGGEDSATIQEAIRLFDTAKSLEDLPSEQRGLIVGAKVRHDDSVSLDTLFEAYKHTHNPDLQMAISAGLCRSKNPEHIRRIIDNALGDDGFVRPQDVFRWFAYLMRSRYSRELAWQWLQDNWPRLEEMFGSSKSFEHFVVYSAAPITTTDWEERFREFFEPKLDNIVLKRNIKIAQGEIAARVAWRKRDEPGLLSYFHHSVN
jgi:aminopeptidase N